MTNEAAHVYRLKKDRSPSFPFVSLRKAVERATAFWEKHRREATRLATVAPTWGYAVKSSGLAQTVSTLKQFGLIEDLGSGDDRKIQLTDLARRIISDQRPGAREAALREAALSPRLFKEYERWIAEPPSEAHCISELELDRGFSPEAARTFLKAFRETISFASLTGGDILSAYPADEPPAENETAMETVRSPEPNRPPVFYGGEPQGVGAAIDSLTQLVRSAPFIPALSRELASDEIGPLPFSKRLKVELTAHSLGVNAVLRNAAEIDKLIRILEANKALLQDDDDLIG